MRKIIFKKYFDLDFIGRMVRWHINYYLFGKGTPVNAGVYITSKCNCRCIMCDMWKSGKAHVYPRDAQERAIDALSRVGCYYYSVSGGEPTLVEDLPERLAYAARRIPYVHVVTNGLNMDATLAQSLGSSGIKEISLSIDGSRKFHDFMRGVPGAFEKVWNALDLLRTYAPDVRVVINSVLSPYNIEGLRDLNRELDAAPGVEQKFLPLTLHELFGTEKGRELPFSTEPASLPEIDQFLDDAARDKKVVNSPVFLSRAKRFFRGEENLIPEQRHCLYPYHALEFDAQGFAYPCLSGMCFKNGIPPESDLAEYLSSGKYRALQKGLRECARCRGSMMLCYYEPRLNFPVDNLLSNFVKR